MKTVLVSGGTSGIGKSSVLKLLKDGFQVVTFSRSEEKCAALQKELEPFKGKFLILEGDVSSEADVKRIVEQTLETFKTIDILFNNAGFGYSTEVEHGDLKKFQEMLQTNLFGLIALTKEVVPHMKKTGGLILNLVSISGKTSFPRSGYYSATKFGVMGFSDALRKELKEFGIKVCTICPGMVNTNFFSQEEKETRKKIGWNMNMMDVKDITRVVSLVCNQSSRSDIQDITIMHF